MSVSFIPNEINTVCTFQVSSSPSKLILTRSTIKIIHNPENKDQPLLTIEDKNVKVEFSCKNPANNFWSFLALGAGLLVGLLLLSNPAGWIVLACVAGAAVCVGISVYNATQISHKCTKSLKAGSWFYSHDSVFFDKFNAITHDSILKCEQGGMLSPIFDINIANKYASEICSSNRTEIAINAAISFIAGAGIPILLSGFGAAAMENALTGALLKSGGFVVGGTAVVQGGTYLERELIRSNTNKDNEYYQNMNRDVDKNSIIPGFSTSPQNELDPSDLSNLDDLIIVNPQNIVIGIRDNYKNVKLSNQLLSDLKQLIGVDARKIYQTEMGIKITNDLRNGVYPESIVKTVTDGNNVIRPRDLPNSTKSAKALRIENIKGIGRSTLNVASLIAFFFPFIGTYFSEKARQALAKAMEEDEKNGINIVADKV